MNSDGFWVKGVLRGQGYQIQTPTPTPAQGLKDLQKKVQLKKAKFVSGPNGLQACQMNAIETHLRLIVTNGQQTQDASE